MGVSFDDLADKLLLESHRRLISQQRATTVLKRTEGHSSHRRHSGHAKFIQKVGAGTRRNRRVTVGKSQNNLECVGNKSYLFQLHLSSISSQLEMLCRVDTCGVADFVLLICPLDSGFQRFWVRQSINKIILTN